MAPKQSTLGYVKPSQTTLGCVAAHTYTTRLSFLRLAWVCVAPSEQSIANLHPRKFFGRPNGSASAPQQQTKLAFATKSTAKDKKPALEEDASGNEGEERIQFKKEKLEQPRGC